MSDHTLEIYREAQACAETNLKLQAELAAARATIARVEKLLGKWGPASVRGVYNDYARDAYMTCFNDLSAALHPPETPAQAAERVAEHAEETRLDLMQDADAGAEA